MAFSHPIFAHNLFTKLHRDDFLTYPYYTPARNLYANQTQNLKKN